MLNNSIRILDFDDSLLNQKNLLIKYPHQIVDLKDLGPLARLWANRKIFNQVKERIGRSNKNSVTFLGSGDFHHVTNALLSELTRPFSLIVFDFHPDWDTLPPRFGCGSWVTEALKNKLLKKCILVGTGSDDISTGSMQTANLDALCDGRLEIYPYSHGPSRVFLRHVPNNLSLRLKRTFLSCQIEWNELKGKNPADFMQSIVKRLPTQDVHVSVDKDCLKEAHSLTNWEEGPMSLSELLSMIRVIKDNLNLAGMDITGDYSPINISGRFKALLSRLDHPKEVSAQNLDPASIAQINESTNLSILESIGL
ncbi:MAG: arginase family protein [Candidatus Omnitrophica bacterium]|nr:arginase family protein [Candidatus Omnitrophota bacterium]